MTVGTGERLQTSFTCRTRLSENGGISAIATAGDAPDLRIGRTIGSADWSPQELFVASLQSCLLMTLANLAGTCGVHITECESEATADLGSGMLEKRVQRVTIRPTIRVHGETAVATARTLVQQALENCRIANSVRCEVVVYPTITSTSHPR